MFVSTFLELRVPPCKIYRRVVRGGEGSLLRRLPCRKGGGDLGRDSTGVWSKRTRGTRRGRVEGLHVIEGVFRRVECREE